MDKISMFRCFSIVITCVCFHNCDGQHPFIVYNNGISSERNLPVCYSPRTACNFIQKRFWLTPMVKRLCKCPDRTECPQSWVDKDKHTIMVNNRAQLKFCGQVGDLNSCTTEEVAATIETGKISSNSQSYIVEIKCFCPHMHYFNKYYQNTSKSTKGNLKHSEFYKCLPFKACDKGEFCGHITATFYETYHVCTCPSNHICIMKNRKTFNVVEAMYEGKAYKGVCITYDP